MSAKTPPRPASRAERLSAIAIFALLATIAAAVFLRSRRFDPALFAFNPALEQAPPAPARLLTAGLALAGFEPSGDVEYFSAATMHQKINGKIAEYLKYDVRSLEFRSFKRDSRKNPAAPAADDFGLAADAGEQFVDVYLYDMQAPENAKGAFAAERGGAAESAGVGRESYVAGESVFFWSGRHYAQVLVSEPAAGLAPFAAQLAKALEALLARGDGPDE